ncbi:GAP family protein [Spongiactinospora sp. TRM90649]|uniref:GAP family protein n=1 Tax=Spongiactinospora sp. TRM90649 TaxID=3031114 RepID=UPI0023FA0C34|nr:GAP family protein [Spongiactinospora sp. TRM90649]MDF5758201.1 GAP family protein [Spongiactinospora sp. TRM90649]
MSAALLGSLAVLALIDSTSIGTLVVPIFLMLSRDRALGRRVLVYLLTVAVFYFAVGAALMLGLMPLIESMGGAVGGPALWWAEAVAGVLLFGLSFRFDPKRRAKRGGPDRSSWASDRVAGVGGSTAGVALLGVTAAGIEVATMLPYLAAIGLLLNAALSPAVWAPVLAAYNVVMILPALLLLLARLALRDRLDGLLGRLGAWFSRHAASMLSWAMAIIGFLLARDGLTNLFLSR